MMIPIPRDYQKNGMFLTRKAYSEGKRKILFWLATGGGKSIIFLMLIHSMLLKKKKVCFVVRRKQLVIQTQRHFKKAGIESSILMANKKGFDANSNFHICSIDTIKNRDLSFLKGFDTVIVDEAHDAVSPSYQNFLRICEIDLGVKFFIGLTATPFPVGGKVHTFWDSCVKPIEIHELVERGFLVDCDLFLPDDIDLDGIDIVMGDYNQRQLSLRMRDMKIIGDTVAQYLKYGQGKPAICFCVDKMHSITVCESFKAQGITAVHCDESTSQDDRDKAINDLKKHQRDRKPFVLCNVNIFSTGTDIPEAEVGLISRPTKSETLFMQMIGRLLRPCRICGKCNSQYDNSPQCPICNFDRPSYIKRNAIIIDQGHNTKYLGHPFMVRYPTMTAEDKEKNRERKIPLAKTCKVCGRYYPVDEKKCPYCDGVEVREKFYKTKGGEFRLWNEYDEIKKAFTDLQILALQHNRKQNWKFFQLYERFGDIVMKYNDELKIPKFIPFVYKKSREEELKGVLYT